MVLVYLQYVFNRLSTIYRHTIALQFTPIVTLPFKAGSLIEWAFIFVKYSFQSYRYLTSDFFIYCIEKIASDL